MALVKTQFQPGNKLPASKLNEIQDAILENTENVGKVEKSTEDIKKDVHALKLKTTNTVTSINGVKPDEHGNVNVETGGVTEDDLKGLFSVTTKVDFTNWDSGNFTETLSDGSTVTHDVLFDGDGNVIGIGDITVEGLD